MPKVLTESSIVACGHSGTVKVSGSKKLTVNGSPILLKSSIEGQSVTSCTTVPASDASGPTHKPCTKVALVTAGEAEKLMIGGISVMIDTLAGKTDGMVAKKTPQELLSSTANQTKLITV
ncbi:MAG: hypothetical protein KDI79_17245 [Anaerolineae bacterium]|nr:hypothetical protein [Anaerolineae bacterium]